MDKATIQAAIKEGKEQLETHVKDLQVKGQQIGKNRQAMKEKSAKIEDLKQDFKQLEFVDGQLKDELQILKLREERVKATIETFESMLPFAQ